MPIDKRPPQDPVKAAIYNPKEFRSQAGGRNRPLPTARPARNGLRNFVISMGVSLATFAGINHLLSQRTAPRPAPAAAALPVVSHASPSLPTCSPLPGRGSPAIIDPTSMQNRAGVPFGTLTVKNDQPVTAVAVLMDVAESRQLQAITVSPRSSAQVIVPSGMYGLRIFAGSNWCNLDIGFTNGTRHRVPGGVEIKGKTTTLTTVSPSSMPGQIAVGHQHLRGTEETQPGVLVVRQSWDGYVTPGSLNGVPIPFMIDTGASNVAISTALAQQAGIRCIHQSQHSTANGWVTSCKGIAAELVFGPFRLTNVEVSVLPNIAGAALLGMDVLRRFHMEWNSDTVQIIAAR